VQVSLVEAEESGLTENRFCDKKLQIARPWSNRNNTVA